MLNKAYDAQCAAVQVHCTQEAERRGRGLTLFAPGTWQLLHRYLRVREHGDPPAVLGEPRHRHPDGDQRHHRLCLRRGDRRAAGDAGGGAGSTGGRCSSA